MHSIDNSREQINPTHRPSVAAWPVMGRLAVALHLVRAYMIWLLLWHDTAQADGRGWFEDTPALVDNLAGRMQCSRRTVARALADGAGLFWQRGAGRIFMVGQKPLGKRLAGMAHENTIQDAYERESGFKYPIPVYAFFGLKVFQAECLRIWVAMRPGGRRITWDNLEPSWGRTQPAMREWVAAAGLFVTENYGRIEITKTAHGKPNELDLPPHGERRTVGGRDYVYYQRGNTYTAPGCEPLSRGAAKALRRATQIQRQKDLLEQAGIQSRSGQCSNVYVACESSGGLSAVAASILAGTERVFCQRTNHEDREALRRARREIPGLYQYLASPSARTRHQARRSYRVWEYVPAVSA